MNDTTKATPSNQSSEKLLTVMEALSYEDTPVRLQDLSKKLSMNASTVLRFLSTLQSKGYVQQESGNGRYFLTYKICSMANRVIAHTSIRNISAPYLKTISQIFGETANLSVEQNMLVVYIAVSNGPNQMLTTLQRIGNVAPMHCTGVGKLFLLNHDSEQIDQMIAAKKLTRFTNNTIMTKEMLMKELETVRRQGYAFDNEECEIGVRCIAAPIKDYTGRTVACLSVSGPTTRMTDEFIYDKLPYLLNATKEISSNLGYIPG